VSGTTPVEAGISPVRLDPSDSPPDAMRPSSNGAARGPRTTLSGQSKLKMLDLPVRGDRVAWRWLAIGVVIYFGLSAALLFSLATGQRASGAPNAANSVAAGAARVGAAPPSGMRLLFGLGDQPNYTVLVLVVGGVLLTFLAVAKLVADIRAMTKEEQDLAWIERTGAAGLRFVFADGKDREALYRRYSGKTDEWDYTSHEGARVETLADDRVRRVLHARSTPGSAHVSSDELRAVAEKRTAQYGSFARYSASLLLLLAVLGTFAGVKTALPGLIEALRTAGEAGNSMDPLVGPLQAIAGAFGGNALALVGAIAVGFAAQGVSSAAATCSNDSSYSRPSTSSAPKSRRPPIPFRRLSVLSAIPPRSSRAPPPVSSASRRDSSPSLCNSRDPSDRWRTGSRSSPTVRRKGSTARPAHRSMSCSSASGTLQAP
jgi:hypothetical protein